MKRIILLSLTLALCLTLCACGVDKQYKPLLENLETGNFEGIKNELSILSPDFKAEQEQMAENAEALAKNEEILAKYDSLINLLEAEQFEEALQDVISRIPVPEGPSEEELFVTVELTPENINDYLEFRPYQIEYVDAFGEGTGKFDCGVAISSKVFDQGLIYWSSEDVGIEVFITHDYFSSEYEGWSVFTSGSQSFGWESGSTVLEQPFGFVVYGFNNEQETLPDFHPETLSFGNAKGTLTFVRAEYVESISNEGGRTVTLTTGDTKITGYWINGVNWPENIIM